MRARTWQFVGIALAVGAVLALRRRSAVLQGLADIFGELAAIALVAHAQSIIDQKEKQPC